ncbi:membrane magnesium transporter-domain-containing protein [Podospora didyma]|uniref:Membrane magnesium transporter-domain-containing protein n=1 Tax=Podospora didyma TaxID=330526 RepID=A0AAE0U8B4_9PEZI|nr:membrane magnesium transporter-domain-containing protein [Podospora didyma]
MTSPPVQLQAITPSLPTRRDKAVAPFRIMTWISKTITLLGAVLLGHACYSAQEHSALQSFKAATTTLTSTSAVASLPIDIAIETVVATLVILLGLVLGTRPLRPIQWNVWAGKIEREGEEGFLDSEGEMNRDFVGNPFSFLETRPGFVDIRKQRKEFAGWIKNSGPQ